MRSMYSSPKCRLQLLPFGNGSLKIRSAPLGVCIWLFLKKFFSNFRSHIKDSKWGRKCIFINCTSCNGSPQQIPFQFANGKLPHSRCRAFWALSGISKLYVCMNSNLNHAVSWPCMTFGNIAGIVILNSVFKVFTASSQSPLATGNLNSLNQKVWLLLLFVLRKKNLLLLNFGA